MLQKALVLSLACILPMAAETLSQGERDRVMSHLHATRKLFVDATSPLSPAQWKFKSAPNRWSVAECAEHLTDSENFLRDILTGTVAKSPVDEKKRAARRADREAADQKVAQVISDRSQRAQAPEPLRPTGKFTSQTQVIDEFRKRRDQTITFAEQTQDDLRGRYFSLGETMEIDLYQLLFMISAHTERHVKQMREVMADPNFPKK